MAEPQPASTSPLPQTAAVGSVMQVPVGTRIEGQFVYADMTITAEAGGGELEIVLLRQELTVQSQSVRVLPEELDGLRLQALGEFAVASVPVDVGHARMAREVGFGLATSILSHLVQQSGWSKKTVLERLAAQPGFDKSDFNLTD